MRNSLVVGKVLHFARRPPPFKSPAAPAPPLARRTGERFLSYLARIHLLLRKGKDTRAAQSFCFTTIYIVSETSKTATCINL